MNKANNTKLRNYILQLGYKIKEEHSSGSTYFYDENQRKLIRLSDHISMCTSANPALNIVCCKNSNLFIVEYNCRVYDAIQLSEAKNLIQCYIKFQDMVMDKSAYKENKKLEELRNSNAQINAKNITLLKKITSLNKEIQCKEKAASRAVERTNKKAVRILMTKLNLSRKEAKELVNSQV